VASKRTRTGADSAPSIASLSSLEGLSIADRAEKTTPRTRPTHGWGGAGWGGWAGSRTLIALFQVVPYADQMTIAVLSTVLVVTMAAFLWALQRPGKVVHAAEAVPDDIITALIRAEYEHRLVALEQERDLIRAAVAEGISHVERVENRIRATVRRANEELADRGIEHPGLQAEARELSILDGDGGEESILPLVREDLVHSRSSVPGVSAEQMARVRGGR